MAPFSQKRRISLPPATGPEVSVRRHIVRSHLDSKQQKIIFVYEFFFIVLCSKFYNGILLVQLVFRGSLMKYLK